MLIHLRCSPFEEESQYIRNGKKINIKMKAFSRQKTPIHVDYVVTKLEIDALAFVYMSSNRFVCCEKA